MYGEALLKMRSGLEVHMRDDEGCLVNRKENDRVEN